ncbi:MAG TPA: amidohydrolase family protein [Candidatus Acidoferrales bacterium]|nr:amidohydrolase family protein [Candidatus Acidoferrales bacterium]
MRRLRRWLIGFALAGAVVYFLFFWPMRDPHPQPPQVHGTLAIRDARIYTSPDAPPLEHATLVARDGRIIALAPDATIPPGALVLRCHQCVVTAGFWNVHVHFTQPKWDFSAWKSRQTLDAQLADMLTSRGFTTVADLGSDLRITLSLRRRIESGDLLGPAIYTAGSPLYPPHAIPFYLRDELPFYVLWFFHQPESPQAAAIDADKDIARGADLIKLFTGSYVARGHVVPMPQPIARAAVQVAHRHGQLVFSHPSDLAGTQVAIAAGVDVLAHAPDTTEGVDRALLADMVARHMAMVPTLKMFATTVTTSPSYLGPIYAEVRQFHELGGQLLFGTDVGYMTDYTTDGEFSALAKCGLNAMDILRMLTSAPAARFGVAAEKGTLAPGKSADFVVLDADPADDVTAFSRVRATVRRGQLIFTKP